MPPKSLSKTGKRKYKLAARRSESEKRKQSSGTIKKAELTPTELYSQFGLKPIFGEAEIDINRRFEVLNNFLNDDLLDRVVFFTRKEARANPIMAEMAGYRLEEEKKEKKETKRTKEEEEEEEGVQYYVDLLKSKIAPKKEIKTPPVPKKTPLTEQIVEKKKAMKIIEEVSDDLADIVITEGTEEFDKLMEQAEPFFGRKTKLEPELKRLTKASEEISDTIKSKAIDYVDELAELVAMDYQGPPEIKTVDYEMPIGPFPLRKIEKKHPYRLSTTELESRKRRIMKSKYGLGPEEKLFVETLTKIDPRITKEQARKMLKLENKFYLLSKDVPNTQQGRIRALERKYISRGLPIGSRENLMLPL